MKSAPPESNGDPLPVYAEPSAPTHLLWARFFTVFRRRWWIFLLTLPLALGGAAAYVKFRPPSFVSTARMWVTGKFQINEGGQYKEEDNFFATQIELMPSVRLQERAFTRLKTVMPEYDPPKDPLGNPISPKLTVSQASKSSVFILRTYSAEAKLAQAYLDALMDEFLAYRREVRAATSGDALSSISEQIYKQERELKLEQEKLSQFQKDNNLALLEEQVRSGGSQLAQLNTQLAMYRLERNLLDAAALEQTLGLTSPHSTNLFGAVTDTTRLAASASSQAGLLPTDFVTSQRQVEVLKLQREQLSKYLRPKHPKIVKLDEQISQAEKLVEFTKTQTQQQLATARQALELRIKSIEAAVAELETRVTAANRNMAEYDRIRAAISRQQGFYDRLLTLLQGVDINSSLNRENLAIIDRAGPAEPADKPAWMILSGAGAGGIGLGFGILFLLARITKKCESIDELRVEFPEQIFGQLPEVRQPKANGHLPVLQLQDPRHVFAESCRNLRSSLIYVPVEGERPRTVLVTSAAPDEGKSTIAINLAYALAVGGARVLLIDADLRRGGLHDVLGLPAEPGLTSLVDGGDPGTCIVPTSLPHLSFLPRGKAVAHSGEVFLMPGFTAWLAQARADYHYVILDTIPVFAADDTTTLAPLVDGVLFVVRRGRTDVQLAREALELLYQRQARILGLVLNRANTKTRGYYYYKHDDYHRPKKGAKNGTPQPVK